MGTMVGCSPEMETSTRLARGAQTRNWHDVSPIKSRQGVRWVVGSCDVHSDGTISVYVSNRAIRQMPDFKTRKARHRMEIVPRLIHRVSELDAKPGVQADMRPQQTMPPEGRRRVVIERISPEIDCGRFPVKRVIGETVVVEADIFADGHD